MLNITIDGPAGAGKSSVAKIVAKKLNIVYLDTGAIYRGLAYSAIKEGINVENESEVEKFLKYSTVEVKYIQGEQIVYCQNEDTTPYIREHNISKAASDISKHKVVRIKMSEIQREIAKNNDVVLDGRDAGTFVLPDANYKFYLTADVEIRAERRFLEFLEKGSDITYEKVLSDIKKRDFNDLNRDFAPLKKAKDARIIDSTKMSIVEVVDIIIKSVKNKE